MIRILVSLAFFTALHATANASDLAKAEQLYQATHYRSSLALLDKDSADGPTNFLLGRNYLMAGNFKKASEALEKAASAESSNSEYKDWLGRAYGRRAETASFFSAPGLASKARQAFEKAVELDGKNKDALSDLFDYYMEAPGFLGGGYDKASAVAQKMSVVDPPQAHAAKARLAEKQEDFKSAEQSLRTAVAAAPDKAPYLATLAKFLARQGRIAESDAVFAQVEKSAPNSPQIWFAEAETLIRQKRNLDTAKRLLQRYIQAPLTPDNPPREEAEKLLKQAGGA